jgi:hypothetical protein
MRNGILIRRKVGFPAMMKFNQKHKGINENDFSMKKDI